LSTSTRRCWNAAAADREEPREVRRKGNARVRGSRSALRPDFGVDHLEALTGADYIIEAIVEQAAAKQTLFKTLDGLLPAHAILASNTSSISITLLAAPNKAARSRLGMHFMNRFR
jgi:3-hydroxybutyryl-CoA dehydrogenase